MRTWTGVLFVVVSAAGFSTLGILGRYAYADGLDPLTILFLRFTMSTAIMAVILGLRREGLPRGRVLLQLVGMGAVGYVGQGYFYLSAVKYASPGLVALLIYLYPTFVALLSAIWLHESLSRLKVLALGLALAGTALIVAPAGGQWLGILFAIVAAAIYSVYIIVGAHVLRQVSAIQSSTVIFASAGIMSDLLMLGSGPHLPASGVGWMALGAIVVLATVLPAVAFLVGIDRIGATNAAMLSTLEPVMTVLLAAVLLGETLTPLSLLGGALVLAAVLLVTAGELRHSVARSTGNG